MKRILSVLLCVCLMLCAAASADETAANDAADPQVNSEAPAAEPQQDEEETDAITEQVLIFFSLWSENRQTDMQALCSPAWKETVENPKTALFGIMANMTPVEFRIDQIDNDEDNTSRVVTIISLIDRNNGKDPVRIRFQVLMEQGTDGLWYVNPESLRTYEKLGTEPPENP